MILLATAPYPPLYPDPSTRIPTYFTCQLILAVCLTSSLSSAATEDIMKLLQAILGVAGFAPKLSNPPPPDLSPDHPASIQFNAWLSAFNTGDKEVINAYHSDLPFPPPPWMGPPEKDAVEGEVFMAEILGGFDVAKIEAMDDPSIVVVIAKTRIEPFQHFRFNMSVDISRPAYPPTRFHFMPVATPLDLVPHSDPLRSAYEQAMKPLTAGRRQAVIDGFLDVLEEHYVDPNVGSDIEAMLRANVENGEYDEIEDNEKFALRLTNDLRSHEKFIFVQFFEPRPELSSSPAGPTPQHTLEQLVKRNFGFGNTSFDTESVPGRTIATLPIHSFIPIDQRYSTHSEEIRAAVGDILSGVADADALIIDLRKNHGGDTNTVTFMESYLLGNAPLHTMDMLLRNGSVGKAHYTLTVDELPSGSKLYGEAKPLFLLTSYDTLHVAENFAYSLKHFKRAHIIGDGNCVTRGFANDITRTHFLAEDVFGKGWWFAGFPNLRPDHATMHSNWGRRGVASNSIAGKGKWRKVKDAKEVARQLAIEVLTGF